ncbi:MAG: hypothetical protein PUG16_07565 [Lachnospiraceae bacterium]|nr:hypothetical protein [Lachnospiraceae bacterium]
MADEAISTQEADLMPSAEELEKYGYVFSVKKTLVLYLLITVLMLLLGRFFSLRLIPQIVVLGFTFLMLPFFIRNTLRSRYNQRRFSDLNTYMEQFLYSFQKNGKVLTTLEEVRDLFEDGLMKDLLDEAVFYITETFDEGNVERKALRLIEREYPNFSLRNIHKFALDVEKNGGNYSSSIQLLLSSRQMWADRNYSLLKEKRHARSKVILSILTSLILCALVQLLEIKLDVDVSRQPVLQGITAFVLCLDLLIFYLTDRKFVQDDAVTDLVRTRDVLESKNYLHSYNPKNPLSRLGAETARKRVTRQIEKDFPNWLMQVSLLLQTENVQVAIKKSFADAPPVLKSDLDQLIDDLEMDPISIHPYLNFLKDYTLPEVRSAMKMLYSLSEGKGGEAAVQIRELIQRNQLLQDRAARLSNEDAIAGMFLLFLAPQLTGGLMMLADMIVMFSAYLLKMGSV